MVAKYVGSGGTGCGASGSTAWTCTVVDDDTGRNTGYYSSIAFAPDGTPYISYDNTTSASIMVAKYVGSGGTGCGASGSTAWTCVTVNEDASGVFYGNNSIAFSPGGTPYIAYQDSTNAYLKIANM